MKNIKPQAADARLIKEWTTRLRQLTTRKLNRLHMNQIGEGKKGAVEEAQRQIDAAYAHLRAFDWEKKR